MKIDFVFRALPNRTNPSERLIVTKWPHLLREHRRYLWRHGNFAPLTPMKHKGNQLRFIYRVPRGLKVRSRMKGLRRGG